MKFCLQCYAGGASFLLNILSTNFLQQPFSLHIVATAHFMMDLSIILRRLPVQMLYHSNAAILILMGLPKFSRPVSQDICLQYFKVGYVLSAFRNAISS